MSRESGDESRRFSNRWLWSILILAPVLALVTWLLLTTVPRAALPDDLKPSMKR